MRTGATQSSPKASPDTRVTVNGDVYASINIGGEEARLISVYEDEKIWGGYYIIELDNSDEALNSKEYKGLPLTLYHGFIGDDGSDLAPLWVLTQGDSSREGKLTLRLLCMDIWGLLSMISSNVGAEYWNYKEQAPGEPSDNPEQYDKTIFEIVSSIIDKAIGKEVVLDDDDGIINTQSPPIYITNARSGVRQLMEMTKSYLLWKNDGKFHVTQPDIAPDAVEYSYDEANLFFSNVTEASVTIPNRIIYHGITTGGVHISGLARDGDSYVALGNLHIDRHYYYRRTELNLLTTVAQCSALAAGTLHKIQAERSQGILVAPMHCSQELFDKVEVVDSRYDTPKTTTGYVHRIVREYDRGIYKMTLYLGGVFSGFTPEGGDASISLAQMEEPRGTVIELVDIANPGFHPIDPAQVIPASNDSWVDIDCSSHIPSGATGVVLHYNGGTLGSANWGVRKKGSTDARLEPDTGLHHTWLMVGVDGDRVFQAYVHDNSEQELWIVGYTGAGIVMLTNGVDVTPASQGAWVDTALSATCPSAIGIILEFGATPQGEVGVRKTGSSDTFNRTHYGHFWAVIGCDVSQHIDIYVELASTTVHVVGYITAGAVLFTTAVDKTPARDEAWHDIDCSAEAPGANMLIFEVYCHTQANSIAYGLRKNGSAEDITRGMFYSKAWAIVECDSDQVVEGWAPTVDPHKEDFHIQLVGYTAIGFAVMKIWIEGTKIHYIDANGDERWLEGTLV